MIFELCCCSKIFPFSYVEKFITNCFQCGPELISLVELYGKSMHAQGRVPLNERSNLRCHVF